MEQVSIWPLQESDLPEAVEVSARAYATNPLGMAVYREHPDKKVYQEGSYKQLYGHMPGQVFIAKKDEQVVGVMRMVEWPHCQMSLSLTQTMRILLPAMLTRNRGLVLRRLTAMRVWSKHHPEEPHWHLGPIAVVPEMQGRGIGTQLLEHFCEHVDQAGQAAYLETDRPENVPLYERFGFSITEEAPVLSVRNWFMWRLQRQDVSHPNH
jgi:ribosomal protein S18 acetylase RimI-like enzyme